MASAFSSAALVKGVDEAMRRNVALLLTSMGVFARGLCFGKAKKKGALGLLAPLGPVAAYLGVMGAPVYGRDLIPGSGGMVDFETLAPRFSPNEHLAAPSDLASAFDDDSKREAAPTFPVSADDLRAAFEEMFAARQPFFGATFASPTLQDEEKRRFVYVERTPLLRFPDVVNVQFVPLTETTSTLCLHSQSVYGYDDLGKNKQRVGDMLKALRDLPASMLKSTVTV